MTVKLCNVLAVAMLTLALGASGASAGIINRTAAQLQEKSSSKKADTKSSSSAEQPRSSSPRSSAAPVNNGRAAGGSRSGNAGSGSSDSGSRGNAGGSRSGNSGSRSGAGGSSSGASGSRSGSSSSGNAFGSLAGAAESDRPDSRDPRSGDRDRGADRDRDSGIRGGSRGLNDDLDRLQGRNPDRDRRNDRDRGHDRRPPRVVERLPYGYRNYYWNGDRYYAYRGDWYRPYGASYISIGVPYGLFVTTLPGPYTSFWYGGTRYFHYDSTYYVYEPVRRGYVVSHSPYEDEDPEQLGDELYVYPAQGQSEQQQADDRYECHRWAVDQTGYNPLDDEYDAERRADYLRAMTACLTGRGYTVN